MSDSVDVRDASPRIAAWEGAVAWLTRAVPTALVLGLLVGLAVWGHRTGWTFSREAPSSGRTEGAADWCEPHGVPEPVCVECHPELLPGPQPFGWCGVHGVRDCPWEHPDVAELENRPRVTQRDLDRADRALRLVPRPAHDPTDRWTRRVIQFASAEAADKAGIDVGPAWEKALTETVTASGEVAYDPALVARLSPRAPGTAWYVTKKVGDRVQRGEVLALIDAAEAGRAKAEFLQALVHERLKGRNVVNLHTAGTAVPERQLREAEAAHRDAELRLLSAEQALVNLGLSVWAADFAGLAAEEAARRVQFVGLPEAVRSTLDPKTSSNGLLPVTAPFDGEVTASEVVPGEGVEPTRVLFVVTDTRRMWLTLSVTPEAAKLLSAGQPVRFRPDGLPDDVAGTLDWVSPAADEKTRTVKARAELPNPVGRLRAHTFGRGRVVLREEPAAVVVPSEAVLSDGASHLVFVRGKDYLKPNAPKVFFPRMVRPGAQDGDSTELIAGVLPGEVVVTKGGDLLLKLLRRNKPGQCPQPAANDAAARTIQGRSGKLP
jgi:cobalt-zinc-cadmium efflux system membrane fusion protein